MKPLIISKIAWLVVCMLVFTTNVLYAQNGNGGDWHWPEDRKTAEEKIALYTDALKSNNYQEANKHLQWLLTNSPDLNPSIYINGAKIYEELAEKSQGEERQQYIDKTLEMYDKRMEYFGETPAIMDRKLNTAFKLMYRDNSKHAELYEMFQQSFNKYGSKSAYYNILPYMNLARLNYKAGNISSDDVLDVHGQLISILDEKIVTGKREEKLAETKEKVDLLLVSTVDLTCEQIASKFGTQLDKNPENIELAEKILKLSLSFNCSGTDLFMKAAMISAEANPNAGMFKIIGERMLAEDKLDSAEMYLTKAADLETDPEKKAELYYDLANINYKKGNKVASRDFALKAVETNASVKEKAYTLIGHMYMGSGEQCKKGENVVEDRAVYLAAYDMYQRAGNTEGMTIAKEQFPSKEDIFNYDIQIGDDVDVGCWINTSTTVRTRD